MWRWSAVSGVLRLVLRARGGVARIGQLQLVQPVLTMLWSAMLLGERVTWEMALAAAGVLGSVALTQRSRVLDRGPS
jgi:drug/metabolite transporter (DMT)-like permease